MLFAVRGPTNEPDDARDFVALEQADTRSSVLSERTLDGSDKREVR